MTIETPLDYDKIIWDIFAILGLVHDFIQRKA